MLHLLNYPFSMTTKHRKPIEAKVDIICIIGGNYYLDFFITSCGLNVTKIKIDSTTTEGAEALRNC